MTADRTDAQESDSLAPGDASDTWIATSVQDEFLRQSIDAIIITDRHLRVRVWNPAAERLYAVPATTAVGQPLGEIVDTWKRRARSSTAWRRRRNSRRAVCGDDGSSIDRGSDP